jgi:hypothetical protein
MANRSREYREIDEPTIHAMAKRMDEDGAYMIMEAGTLLLEYRRRGTPVTDGILVHLIALIGLIGSSANSHDEADKSYAQLGVFILEHYNRAVTCNLEANAADDAETR